MTKKHILAAAAVALLAAGGAMAQSNDRGVYQGDPGYGGSGWHPGQVYGADAYGSPNVISQARILRDGRLVAPGYYGYATPYERTSRDRDGDGVRNSRDRYPDDPRYR